MGFKNSFSFSLKPYTLSTSLTLSAVLRVSRSSHLHEGFNDLLLPYHTYEFRSLFSKEKMKISEYFENNFGKCKPSMASLNVCSTQRLQLVPRVTEDDDDRTCSTDAMQLMLVPIWKTLCTATDSKEDSDTCTPVLLVPPWTAIHNVYRGTDHGGPAGPPHGFHHRSRMFFKGQKWEFTLNTDPFDVKEHVLITIFPSSGAATVYAIHIVAAVKMLRLGWAIPAVLDGSCCYVMTPKSGPCLPV